MSLDELFCPLGGNRERISANVSGLRRACRAGGDIPTGESVGPLGSGAVDRPTASRSVGGVWPLLLLVLVLLVLVLVLLGLEMLVMWLLVVMVVVVFLLCCSDCCGFCGCCGFSGCCCWRRCL